jgi:hypothetical protein
MLSRMHIGSVLVGIVIGLALGVLIGWPVGRRRSRRRSDELPLLAHPPPMAHAAVSRQPAYVLAELSGEETEPASTASAPVIAVPRAEEQPLIETLRSVNKRLTVDTQARLSRDSADVSAASAPEPAAESGEQAASVSPGAHLLELSRRLTEDTTRRMGRDPEPNRP